jgi:nucleotide-binding universal stress UspA family protein
MPEAETAPSPAPEPPPPPKTFDRVFLVVIDETPERAVALRYACLRARKTGGRVALLYVIEPVEFQQWAGVSQLMEEEARQAAEQLLQKTAAEVQKLAGSMPVLYVREGQRTEQLLKLIAEEPGISILVLGAAPGAKGPGPIVSALTGKHVGQLRVPVTIVPGSLTLEDIEKIA